MEDTITNLSQLSFLVTRKRKMKNKKYLIFTIGHSNHSLEAFVSLLQQHGITALVDVRSSPFSRFTPQFNKMNLEREMGKYHIKYVFLGRELGARPKDSSCYKNGEVQLDQLESTTLFREGIERLIRGAQQYTIALMCSEKDPLQCHRFLLVAHALVKHGAEVTHILATGALESHEKTIGRLPNPVEAAQDDLFDSKEDLARSLQKKRIAYVDKEKISNKTQGMA